MTEHEDGSGAAMKIVDFLGSATQTSTPTPAADTNVPMSASVCTAAGARAASPAPNAVQSGDEGFTSSDELDDETPPLQEQLEEKQNLLQAALDKGDVERAESLQLDILALLALLRLTSPAQAAGIGQPPGAGSNGSAVSDAGAPVRAIPASPGISRATRAYSAPPANGAPRSQGASRSAATDNSPGPPPAGVGAAPDVAHDTADGGSIKGLDPLASDALRSAGVSADQVSQGEGHAAASAGFHESEPGSRYTAAVDIRTGGQSERDIRETLDRLGEQGFAAWYRHGSDWSGNEHIHAVYAGIPMKDGLEDQVRDFLAGRSGLTGHVTERGQFAPSARAQQVVESLFRDRNRRVAVQD